MNDDGQIPACSCGGLARPDVVWFGELLRLHVLEQAGEVARRAGVFFSVGTSGTVYPAAGLAAEVRGAGALLVEINPVPTEQSDIFDVVLRGPSMAWTGWESGSDDRVVIWSSDA